MKKIRIGKDIHLTWEILTNGEPQALTGRNLKLVLTNPLRAREDISFSLSGNTVEANIKGISHKHLGMYMLTLWENFGTVGQTAVDACNAFQLVPYTCMEDDSDNGLDTETVDLQTGNLELFTEGSLSTVSWNNVTDKPELFPPSLHRHSVTDVNGLEETITKQDSKLTELEQKIGVISSELDDINGEEV